METKVYTTVAELQEEVDRLNQYNTNLNQYIRELKRDLKRFQNEAFRNNITRW